jgi:glycosyltransferase 2 family protein
MTARKALRLALGLSLAMLFLWLMLRQIRIEDIRRAFEGAQLTWIVGALAAFAAAYSCRIQRWREMLKRENPGLKWHTCAGPLLASFAANNVLPFRAGDVLRAFVFNRTLGTTSGVIIATLLVERLLDLLMVLLLLGAVLALSGMDATSLSGFGGAALLAGAATIILILLCPNVFAPVALASGRLVSRLSPKIGRKISDEISKSLATLRHLAQGNTMLKLISWSLLAWVAEGCVFWFCALSLPSIVAPLGAWLALPIGTLATLIPSTPGYVGTFDYFTVRAMTALGNATLAATAYALMVHAMLWLPPTVIGGLYLLLHPIKRQAGLQVT